MSDYLKRVLIFYGWPSSINGLWEPKACARAFAQFDEIVMPHNLELVTHGDHTNTVKIMSYIRQYNPTARVYGYIPLSDVLNEGFDSIEARVASWKAMGADGIFCDEFGFDYFEHFLGRRAPSIDRETQNQWLDIIHRYEMSAVINGWNVDDVFSESNCGPIHYDPARDIYVSESVPFHSATDTGQSTILKFADSSTIWYKPYQLNVVHESKDIKWWMIATWEPSQSDPRSMEEQFADVWEYALLMAYTQGASGLGIMRKWYYSQNGQLLPVLPDPYKFKDYRHNNTYGYYPNSSYEDMTNLLKYTLNNVLGLTEVYYAQDSAQNYSIPIYSKFGSYAEFELLSKRKAPRKFFYFNIALPYSIPGLALELPSNTIDVNQNGPTTLLNTNYLKKPAALLNEFPTSKIVALDYLQHFFSPENQKLVVYDLKTAVGKETSGVLYLEPDPDGSFVVYSNTQWGYQELIATKLIQESELVNLIDFYDPGASQDWTKWDHWNNPNYWYQSMQYDDPTWGKVFHGKARMSYAGASYLFKFNGRLSVSAGKEYTFGIWVKTSISSSITFTLILTTYSEYSGVIGTGTRTLALSPNEWTPLTITATPNQTNTYVRYIVKITNALENQEFWFAYPKIVESDRNTLLTTSRLYALNFSDAAQLFLFYANGNVKAALELMPDNPMGGGDVAFV